MDKLKPMLAETCEDMMKIKLPVLGSPKLDGIRTLVVDGVLKSRQFIDIPNLYTQKRFAQYTGFDGELIVGDRVTGTDRDEFVFNRTTSAVSRREGEPDVSLYAFDKWDHPGGYQSRLKALEASWEGAGSPPKVIVLEHHLLTTYDQLLAYEEEVVDMGYEGVMVRSLAGPYKHGRSTLNEGWLLKIKRFEDSEAEILDVIPQFKNMNAAQVGELGQTKRSTAQAGLVEQDLLGSFRVRDLKTGVEFNIGTGWSDKQSLKTLIPDDMLAPNLWAMHKKGELVGRACKYQFQKIGTKIKPRFPSWRGLRSLIDMP